ncbi:hypothetical protein C1H76_7894 [Elsinoe australis]|uniref:Rhodopsin domain-containing protein n=1 Tax=Elsinoe australis TaxID=40998 RepID=A0A4U7ATN1_9PEZI|nr:hypothetical protein C1H76_7894 [Elsinoe australis]
MSDTSDTPVISGTGTGNTDPGLTTATVLLFIWGFLTLITRLFVKARDSNTFGHDDTAISISALAALAHVVATCYAVHLGYGLDWSSLADTERTAICKALFASHITYVISIGCTKISTCFFSVRFLTRDTRSRFLAYGFTITCVAWTVVCVLVISLRGQISNTWITTDGSQALYSRWLGIEGTGFAIDLSSVAMSIYLIWGLQMSIGKRLAVSAIFSSRLLVLPLVALRLWKLHPATGSNSTSPARSALIFTEAVMECAFILASVTCLKPFLRPFAPGFFISSAAYTGRVSALSAGHKGSRANPYYELSAARSRAEKDTVNETITQRMGSEEVEDEQGLIKPGEPPKSWRPDLAGHQATVEQTDERHRMSTRGISMTQGWTVSFDRAQH